MSIGSNSEKLIGSSSAEADAQSGGGTDKVPHDKDTTVDNYAQ